MKQVLQWVQWLGLAVVLCSFLVAVAGLAYDPDRVRPHLAGIGYCLLAAVMITAAAALANVIV